MNRYKGYDQYREQQVLTASPGDLILMLYDGAIRQIRLARSAIVEQNPGDAGIALVKAQEIIDALIDSLDLDNDLSGHLLRLYEFFNRELVASNISKDANRALEVEEMLSELRATWEQVVRSYRSLNRAVGG
jgi:flagellar protein FliS